MPYKYSKTKPTGLKDVGAVCIGIFLVICVGCFIARIGWGWGVEDSEVICNKGGEAYVPTGVSHIYRVAAKDYVCKKKE